MANLLHTGGAFVSAFEGGQRLDWRSSGIIPAVVVLAFIAGFSYYLLGMLISNGGHW